MVEPFGGEESASAVVPADALVLFSRKDAVEVAWRIIEPV